MAARPSGRTDGPTAALDPHQSAATVRDLPGGREEGTGGGGICGQVNVVRAEEMVLRKYTIV